MPTGYTAIIEDNKDVTFKDFIMGCARAFGACIDMRDESHDKKIPKEFKIDNYHIKEIEKAQKRFKELNNLTNEQLEDESIKAYNKKLRYYEREIKKDLEIKKRYLKILKEVQVWKPPTRDHISLKRFMREQIKLCTEDSVTDYLDNEINKLEEWSGKKWLSEQLKKVERDIKYHTKEHKKEVKRITGRNQWLKDLRKSL